MCRPFADAANGASNGGHTNFSVWAGGKNLFQDDEAADGLSEYGRHFLAGMMAHARALQVLAAPTVNCYHRVQLDSWAPVCASWGFDNRTAMVRVKTPKMCSGCSSAYFEWRQPSSSANPYIALAGALAAGVDGVKRKLGHTLPQPASGYYYDVVRHDAEKRTQFTWLPTSLRAAIDALKEDEVIVKGLGQSFVDWFSLVKEDELASCPEEFAQQDADRAQAALVGGETAKGLAEWSRKLYSEYI